MKNHLVITLGLTTATFALGFFVGKQSTPQSPTQVVQPTKSNAQSHQPKASAKSVQQLVPATFVRDLEAMSYSERRDYLGEISPEEIPAHIERLLEEAGPGGLDRDLENAISELLKTALAEDPEGTFAWILSNQHSANRDYLFKEAIDDSEQKEWVAANFDSLLMQAKGLTRPHDLLKDLIKTKVNDSPAEAITLSKEYLRDENDQLDYPNGLAEKAVAVGWELTFEYFKDNWSLDTTGGGWSWGGGFPENFNFSSFATAWRAHESEIDFGERGRFYEKPSKIWQEWSEADPQAAFEFFQSKATKTFDFDDFFTGYSKSARPEDIFQFSQEALSGDADYRYNLTGQLADYVAANTNNTRDLLSWSKNQGDFAVAKAALSRLHLKDTNEAKSARLILEAFSPNEVLSQLQDAYRTEDVGAELGKSDREWYTETLLELGHSQADIEAALEVE